MNPPDLFERTFDPELLINIFGYTSEKDVKATLPPEVVANIESYPRYWKIRTELLLSRELQPRNINWRRVYGNLAKAKTNIVKLSTIGDTDSVAVLLEDKRVGSLTNYHEAIMLASKNGHSEVVKLLLEDGRANPSAGNNKVIGRPRKGVT